MSNVKQVIAVRKDLRDVKGNKIHTGKICAQVAHASLKVFFDRMIEINTTDEGSEKSIMFTPEELEWVNGIFTKICLSVNSEAELLEIYNKAKVAGLNCSLIEDAGNTEFGGVKTLTCCCLGPNYSEKIDPITGHLPLL